MADLIETEDRIMEFLRCDVAEPLQSGGSAKQTEATQNFVASASQTEFIITDNPTKNVHCINTVVVAGTTLTKFNQFELDLRDKTVTLLTAATSNDAVKINYDHGNKTWIYSDKPRLDLSETSYPRIAVIKINSVGEHFGSNESALWETQRFQFDLLLSGDVGYTFDSETKYGDDAVKALKRRVETSIEVNYDVQKISDLFYIKPLAKNPSPFDEPNNRFRYIMEYEFKYQNTHS